MEYSGRVTKFLLIGLALLLGALMGANGSIAQAQTESTADDGISELTSANLARFLDGFIPAEMEEAHVPGLVVTIVSGDEVLLSKGYGYADLGNS